MLVAPFGSEVRVVQKFVSLIAANPAHNVSGKSAESVIESDNDVLSLQSCEAVKYLVHELSEYRLKLRYPLFREIRLQGFPPPPMEVVGCCYEVGVSEGKLRDLET